MHIKQYIPYYLETDPKDVVFYTRDELLDIDFVKGVSNHIQFYRFSILRTANNTLLIAEFDDSLWFCVVGYIYGLDNNFLAKFPVPRFDWNPRKKDKI